MKIPDIIIAIDGCSGTGKSSFARALAAETGFLHLDSGALYRAVTLFAQERKLISAADEVSPGLETELRSLDLRFGPDNRTYIGERCVEREIRTMEVSSQVSPISALPYVRAFVDGILHSYGRDGRIIMDGRDIGTTVFPQAQVKIFMTASEQVRAQRRFKELEAKGESPVIGEVLENIRRRDRIDSTRAASPLAKAPDAFVLDNSDMTLQEEVAWARGLLQGMFSIR